MEFQSGDVLKVEWDERPIRILMADAVEAFYDVQLPEIGWNLSRARTAIYYRIATNVLRSGIQRLGSEPLTDAARARHRPDLPMRMLRHKKAEWRKPLASWPDIETSFEVECGRLALIPFGPQGALQKPVVMEAANDHSFTGAELLAAAHEIQVADCPEMEGAGLYRSGVSGGIPSYYLWGSTGRAGDIPT